MSTPDNPESGQLTRRQLREQRTTGASPIIGAHTAVATQEPPAPPAVKAPPATKAAPPAPKAPLARPARPVAVAPAPLPDAAVDLGVSPLTRRQARQQERIRTASVPVITPEIAAAHTYAPVFTPPAIVPQPEPVLWTPAVAEERAATAEVPIVADVVESDVAPEPVADEPTASAPVEAEIVEDEPSPADAEERPAPTEVDGPSWSADATPVDADAVEQPENAARSPRIADRFGEKLLAADDAPDAKAVSFDELLTRDTGSGGSVSTPHALILNHVPEMPLSAVTSTGEVIVTGIYSLPDGIGSQGHAIGAADGKEVDAILVDGELPASSSPTPIAASAAISTVRGTGEIIRAPAPEKSSRLIFALMITAGALALALVGLLVYVVASGVIG